MYKNFDCNDVNVLLEVDLGGINCDKSFLGRGKDLGGGQFNSSLPCLQGRGRGGVKHKKSAFTLAEVLITLGIIGVVAAMTLPSLIQYYKERVFVTSLKKVYTVLSQAYSQAIVDNGTPDAWLNGYENAYHGDKALVVMNTLIPYLKIDKACATKNSACFRNIRYTLLNGGDRGYISTYTAWVMTALADGTFIVVEGDVISPECKMTKGSLTDICGRIMIDTNGGKKPNKVGVDFQYFYYTKKGIYPAGTSEEGENPCTSSWGGETCSAWVIYNENLDYLHCDDLTWSGKRKCSDK